jgi:hypothetical protein
MMIMMMKEHPAGVAAAAPPRGIQWFHVTDYVLPESKRQTKAAVGPTMLMLMEPLYRVVYGMLMLGESDQENDDDFLLLLLLV